VDGRRTSQGNRNNERYLEAPLRRFIGYRPHPPGSHYVQGVANAPDEAQFEGVVFTDGTVAVRWLTQYPATSLWPDWNTFYQVHGHPEYGTVIDWLDGDWAADQAGSATTPVPRGIAAFIGA
jgi:hypothetical protein